MRRGGEGGEVRGGRNGDNAVPKADGGAGLSRQGGQNACRCQEGLWKNRLASRGWGVLQETPYQFWESGNFRLLELTEFLYGMMDWKYPGLVQTPRTKANVCQLRTIETKHRSSQLSGPTSHFTKEETENNCQLVT